MTRAYFINAEACIVREVELPDDAAGQAAAIHSLVGGYFETVPLFTNGDILCVNDDERTLPSDVGRFNLIGRRGTSVAGNGVVVGSRPPDICNASTPLDALRTLVLWEAP